MVLWQSESTHFGLPTVQASEIPNVSKRLLRAVHLSVR